MLEQSDRPIKKLTPSNNEAKGLDAESAQYAYEAEWRRLITDGPFSERWQNTSVGPTRCTVNWLSRGYAMEPGPEPAKASISRPAASASVADGGLKNSYVPLTGSRRSLLGLLSAAGFSRPTSRGGTEVHSERKGEACPGASRILY